MVAHNLSANHPMSSKDIAIIKYSIIGICIGSAGFLA